MVLKWNNAILIVIVIEYSKNKQYLYLLVFDCCIIMHVLMNSAFAHKKIYKEVLFISESFL